MAQLTYLGSFTIAHDNSFLLLPNPPAKLSLLAAAARRILQTKAARHHHFAVPDRLSCAW